MSLQARLHANRGGFVLDAELDAPARGVTALFGPSGSGKTTILRALAGLERLAGAVVSFNGEVWQDEACGVFVPPHLRRIGYVFQEASLFAHLDVRGNLEYGMGRVRASEKKFQLDAVISMLGLGQLQGRRTSDLSGGERQRVAIARALLSSPRLLLMDEPLAALDYKRKQEILPYLERLHDELSIPIVYVSHAPDEVARLADYLVLVDEGKLVASGPLNETLARADLPGAFGNDAFVVLDTTLAGQEDDGLSRLAFDGGVLLVARREAAPGTAMRCRINARDVSLALARPQQSSIINLLPATVASIAATDMPGQVLVQLKVGASVLLARVTERSRRELGLGEGLALWAQVKGVAVL